MSEVQFDMEMLASLRKTYGGSKTNFAAFDDVTVDSLFVTDLAELANTTPSSRLSLVCLRGVTDNACVLRSLRALLMGYIMFFSCS